MFASSTYKVLLNPCQLTCAALSLRRLTCSHRHPQRHNTRLIWLRSCSTQSVNLSHRPLHRQSPTTALSTYNDLDTADDKIYTAPPPPHSPLSAASSSSPPSPRPPPFSSLYFPSDAELDRIRATVTETACDSLLTSAPAPSFEEALAEDEVECKAEAETKAALPPDTKPQSSRTVEEGEPPPPYTEGSSPLDSFSYIMAAAGGAASIITQVQQTPGPPINTLGGRIPTTFKDVGAKR